MHEDVPPTISSPDAGADAVADPQPRSFTIPPGFASIASREYTDWMLTRAPWIVLLTTAALVMVGAIATAILTGDAAVVLIAIVLPLVLGATVISVRRRTTKSLRLSYPDGFVTTLSVSEDELRSATAIGKGSMALRAIRRVHLTPHTLLIVMEGSRMVGIAPRAAFTPADIERLQAAIASRARR